MPDNSLDTKEKISDLEYRSRTEMMRLLGLDNESNQRLIDSLPTYHVESKSLFK